MTARARRSCVATAGLVLLACSIAVGAQDGPLYGIPTPDNPAQGSPYKNLTVMASLPDHEILPAMEAFKAALGVECTYCHVMDRGPGLTSTVLDEKPRKEVARRMIQMTMDIRRMGMRIDCATCHKGRPIPDMMPPIPSADELLPAFAADVAERNRERQAANMPRLSWAAPVVTQPRELPQAEAVLARYERTVGEIGRVRALTTRLGRGTITAADGSVAAIALALKAPGKAEAMVTYAAGLQRTTINGTTAWRGNEARPPLAPPHQIPGLLLEYRFFRDLLLRDQYSGATVLADDATVNGRRAIVVQAYVRDSPFSDTLSFDAESGLLLRRVTTKETLFGAAPEQLDFDDYRRVDGITVPFVIRRRGYGLSTTLTVTRWDEVTFNVPIDDSRFDRPVVPYQPPAR